MECLVVRCEGRTASYGKLLSVISLQEILGGALNAVARVPHGGIGSSMRSMALQANRQRGEVVSVSLTVL